MDELAVSEKFSFIAPSQLCIGLFVHLDLPWTDHPFTFSSFKIKSLDQINTLQSLGLDRVRYSPEKSDNPPLPPSEDLPSKGISTSGSSTSTPLADPAFEIKRQRLDRLTAQRARIKACEGALLNSARTMRIPD